MKLNLRPSLVFLSPFFVLLVLAFQNCSDPSKSNLQNTAAATEKYAPTTQAGNGEGYGGKLNGAYATVDGLNQCGKATTTQVPVKEQIEIQNGMAQKTVENCQRLVRPKAVSLTHVQAASRAGNLFIFQDQIFERAKWVPTGFAPRDLYVDVFCLGEDPKAGASIHRSLEVSIFNTKENPYAGLPGMDALPYTPLATRKANLLVSDLNLQTSEVIKSQNFAYELKETITTDAATGATIHFFEAADSFQIPNNMGFELSYSSSSSSSSSSYASGPSSFSSASGSSSFSGPSGFSTSSSYSSSGTIVPIEMNYGPSQAPQSVGGSLCWAHR